MDHLATKHNPLHLFRAGNPIGLPEIKEALPDIPPVGLQGMYGPPFLQAEEIQESIDLSHIRKGLRIAIRAQDTVLLYQT